MSILGLEDTFKARNAAGATGKTLFIAETN
jgi:hypothetical protein